MATGYTSPRAPPLNSGGVLRHFHAALVVMQRRVHLAVLLAAVALLCSHVTSGWLVLKDDSLMEAESPNDSKEIFCICLCNAYIYIRGLDWHLKVCCLCAHLVWICGAMLVVCWVMFELCLGHVWAMCFVLNLCCDGL